MERPPIFFRGDVSHAVKTPPSAASLKKARCRAGTNPRVAPRMAPSSGALKKSDPSVSHYLARGPSFAHCSCVTKVTRRRRGGLPPSAGAWDPEVAEKTRK